MLAVHTVFNSLAFLESRRLVQVIPEHLRQLWNNWEVRVLVLVSLTLQLCLLHFGCRRRYSAKTWLRVFLWLSYLCADSVAAVALGVISNNQGNCDDSKLQIDLIAFWAPFLLLHLGGQDTITAYAVQDNELWLRHLLGLVVQSGVALYIILLSWKVSWLSYLSIPLFLAGFVKYAERTLVLKSANSDMSSVVYGDHFMDLALGRGRSGPDPTNPLIKTGIFRFFLVVRCLFLNRKADLLYADRSYSDFFDSQSAWNLIEGELGYAYDVYYTKAPLFFTTCGLLIRTFSFVSILFVFVLFLIKESHNHPFVDLIVTYLLLVGAILMEIYGVVLLCGSDWPLDVYMDGAIGNCVKSALECFAYALLTLLRSGCAKLNSEQRWSNSMCQLDLLGLWLKDMSLPGGDETPINCWSLNKLLFKLNRELEILFYMSHKQVSAELKDYVFTSFLRERQWDSNGFVAEKFNNYITDGTESIETYQRIIIWHIATDLCFCTDCDGGDEFKLLRVVSKDISDYLMYILAMLPVVLSTENANRILQISYRDFMYYIDDQRLSNQSKAVVCERLLSLSCWSDLSVYKALLDEKLFYLGVRLAQRLIGDSGMWATLSSFWFENLVYVATLCPGNEHAQLLRNGGEFLTHVWLLEEHFHLSFRAGSALAIKEEAELRSAAGDNAAVAEEEAVAAVPEEVLEGCSVAVEENLAVQVEEERVGCCFCCVRVPVPVV